MVYLPLLYKFHGISVAVVRDICDDIGVVGVVYSACSAVYAYVP